MRYISIFFRVSLCIIFVLIADEMTAMGGQSCEEPTGCTGTGQNRTGILLERTFLKKLRSQKHTTLKRPSKGRNKNMTNPLLELSLDSAHMAALFAVNNTRVQISSGYDTLNTISMDVGDASVDTQYWNIPAFDVDSSIVIQSIDTMDNPYQEFYPNSNYVFKTIQADPGDDRYAHYTLTSEEFTQDGLGVDNLGDPYILEVFETEAFLPIEFGWEISETVTTYWDFNPDIDSSVRERVLVLDATGMLTPINEDPVPAIVAFQTVDYKRYKDGIVIDSGFADSFVWFSEAGHMLIGYLKDHAPTEGETEFTKFIYEKNIMACPPNQDLGIDLYPGEFKAQNKIASGAALMQGPIQFVAGNEIELKSGFSAHQELNLFIDSDPCNF